MGLLNEPAEPETPPPVWSPAKIDIWKKPSRWQICMPRLRLVAKVMVGFVGVLVLYQVVTTKSSPSMSVDGASTSNNHPPPPPPPPPHLSEMELMDIAMEAAKREEWAWKDFPL